jgi:DNA-binding response OmpR family regulator
MENRARILIVEPNRSYLALLARRIAEAGFRVSTSEGAAHALAELQRMPADLVLAELNMPHIGGAELAGLIRGEAQWRDLPIMLITGRSNPKNAVRAYEAGADDVILKPFHFEVLIARIERRLAWQHGIKQLRHTNEMLDARIVERAIAVGELKDRLARSEAALRRLETPQAPNAIE